VHRCIGAYLYTYTYSVSVGKLGKTSGVLHDWPLLNGIGNRIGLVSLVIVIVIVI
jgi:hypothetical protein